MRRLITCVRGVTTLEFALFAPMICLGLLVMVDLGLAVATRMELDRNVRAGAQAAMSLNNDETAVSGIVMASAGFPADLDVDVAMACACGTATALCSAQCGNGDAPSAFFSIRASRPQAGLILGQRTVASETRVQIR